MKCDEIMVKDIERVQVDETCQVAALKMREARCGFLPVCGEDGEVVGALTDRDIAVRLVADGRPSETKVWEVMSAEVVSCREDDDIFEAGRLMAENEKSRIMVLDANERLVGVISLSDLAQVSDAYRLGETMRQITGRESRTELQ